jgi:hypothetical protein
VNSPGTEGQRSLKRSTTSKQTPFIAGNGSSENRPLDRVASLRMSGRMGSVKGTRKSLRDRSYERKKDPFELTIKWVMILVRDRRRDESRFVPRDERNFNWCSDI